MALRFILGAAEAGFGPGSPYLLSFFYGRRELGLRCGLFVSAAPLANTFAGALAYGITSGHALLANWRLLFLVEGAPSLAAAFLAWYFLPDHPSSAWFLTEEEKDVARARSLRRSGEGERVGGVDLKEIFQTLFDVKPWITAVRTVDLFLFDTGLTNGLASAVDVLQLQRELFLAAGIPPDNSRRHGF
jgi:MFS family permease